MAGNTIQEFVVRLGTQIDNSGFQQMLAMLDSNKLKAMGVTAALTAATTAVYKFIEGVTKEEFELRKLARQKNKHLENLRAEQTALKAMGMTLNEIKKDKALQEIYKDIENTNKALALPNLESTLKTVRGLQGAFWKLRSVADYTIEWIGTKVLSNLDVPMKRFTGYFDMITQWVRDKMPYITTKVATYITDFSKGIIGIGEGIGKVFKFINELPDGIKMVGGAVIGLWALIKSGPIGQILTAVTVIGDIIHDYDNYRKVLAGESNVPVGLAPVYEEYDKNGMAGVMQKLLKGIGGELKKAAEGVEGIDLMKILFGSSFDSESTGAFVQNLLDGITKKAEELLSPENAQKVGGNINTFGQAFINLLTAGINNALDFFVGSMGESGAFEGGFLMTVNNLIGNFINFFATAIKQIDFADIGTGIGSFVNGLIERIAGFIEETSKSGSQFAGQLLNTGISLANGIIKLITSGLNQIDADGVKRLADALWTSITNAISDLHRRLTDTTAEDFIDLGSLAETGAGLGEALGSVISIGLSFLEELPGKIQEWLDGGGLGKLAESGALIGKAILDGILSVFGNALLRILVGEDEYNRYKGIRNATGSAEVIEGGGVAGSDTVGLTTDTKFRNEEEATEFAENITELGIIGAAAEMVKKNTDAKNGSGVRVVSATYDPQLNEDLYYQGSRQSGVEPDTYGYKAFDAIYNRIFGYLEQRQLDNEWDESDEAIFNTLNRWSESGHKDQEAYNQIIEYATKNQDTLNQRIITVSGSLEALSSTIGALEEKINSINFNSGEEGEGGDSGSDGPGKAYGGRIGSRGIYEVGEDGPEYIVPITKPDRAFDVLMQMFGEMGGGMLSKLASSFGLGESGTVGNSIASLSNALQDMTVNNTYNISAPVTMYINSTASAEDVGNTAYSMIDRHLINTLRGAYA